jgi:queuine/archaeosine tRNA-ribosyltransferase
MGRQVHPSAHAMQGEKMSDYFESPVLGKTRDATPDEKIEIQKMVDDTAITVFQVLNKRLNELGLAITIMSLEEIQ